MKVCVFVIIEHAVLMQHQPVGIEPFGQLIDLLVQWATQQSLVTRAIGGE